MMEPERDGNKCYPWVLYDSTDFYKPWSIQLLPDLHIRRNFKNKDHFHVLINVKYLSVEDISMKYDTEYLTIEGDYKEKKEQGYECYTSLKTVRRLKLPEGVDMTNVDTWTSKNGFLNILAPIDATPNKDGQVAIYYPCANSKTVNDIAKRTLNCVQEYRFNTMFKQLEAKRDPGPPAPTQSQSVNPLPPAGPVCTSAGTRRPPPGNTGAPAGNVPSSAGNIRAPAGNVQVPPNNTRAPAGNIRAPAGNVQVPPNNTRAPAGNIRAPAGNVQVPPNNTRAPAGNIRAAGKISVLVGVSPRNMYPETENATVQAGNAYSARGNMYAPNGDVFAAPMAGPRRDVRQGLGAGNYNRRSYDYNGSFSRWMYPSEYTDDYENITLHQRFPAFTYCATPRREYIYAAEMDPNSVNE